MVFIDIISVANFTYPSKLHETPAWMLSLAIAFPFILAALYVIYKNLTSTAWEKGKFPEDLKYSKDNLIEAYVCLSAWMIRLDRRSSKEKIEYMNQYFRSHLGNRDFTESLNFAYKHTIEVSTITRWLNIHLDQKSRSQVLYFLVGLALIDGKLNVMENNLLNQVRQVLGISPKELKSIIASYYQQRHRQQQKTKSSTSSSYSRKSALKLSYEVIGVSEHAGMDEVKKAYRTLVKKHHPDRFATESQEQQNIANQRFLEIQKAYEEGRVR